MIRRFGDAPEPGRRYVLRRGVYAVLPLGGDLLLTLQSQPHPDLQLPGGGIDPGESPIAALHREVIEETGWRIADPRRIGAFRRFAYMPEYDLWAEKLCAAIACSIAGISSTSYPDARKKPPAAFAAIRDACCRCPESFAIVTQSCSHAAGITTAGSAPSTCASAFADFTTR